ncbi:MAG: glycosyltransferase family 4 protein [Nitrospinales bacterium]
MRVWLITIGEGLPIDGENTRLLRTGMLAEVLVSRGHEVEYWTSTFNHSLKTQRFDSDATLVQKSGLVLKLIHAIPYKANVSLLRMFSHWRLGRRFRQRIRGEVPPDIIFVSVPIIELGQAALEYGLPRGIPVILDVRDLWPDCFLSVIPQLLRPLGRLALSPWFALTRKCFHECTAITGVSRGYLDWGLTNADRPKTEWDGVFPLGYEMRLLQRENIESVSDTEHYLANVGIDPKKVLFIFVGTFGQSYNLGTVIEAARSLQEEGKSDIQFIFCGSGDHAPRWKAQARGLTNVVFTGWVDMKRIRSLLEVVDVGLMPYIQGATQSLPNKLFEYMAAGLPILSSLDGEARDLIESVGCGWSYRSHDREDLLKRVKMMLGPDIRKRLGTAGQARFRSEFQAGSIYCRLAEYLEAMSHQSAIPSPPNS